MFPQPFCSQRSDRARIQSMTLPEENLHLTDTLQHLLLHLRLTGISSVVDVLGKIKPPSWYFSFICKPKAFGGQAGCVTPNLTKQPLLRVPGLSRRVGFCVISTQLIIKSLFSLSKGSYNNLQVLVGFTEPLLQTLMHKNTKEENKNQPGSTASTVL